MKRVMVVLVCVLVGLAAIFGGAMTYFIVTGSGPASLTGQLARRQEFAAKDLDLIELLYSSDSVELLAAPGDQVVVEEYMSRWDEAMLAQTTHADGALQVREGERPWTIGFFFSSVKLYLPGDWHGTLRLETNSGGINTTMDLDVEQLRVHSSSGSIHLAGVRAAADVSLEATSGSVSANSIRAGGAVALQSSSGSLHLGDVEAGGDIRAEANSGGVQFDSAKAQTVHARTSSGSIRFGRLDGTFELACSSGGVHVDAGRGAGSAKSTSGSVRVALEQLTGDLTLASSSGSVHLDLPPTAAFHFQASTSSGGIHTPFDDSLAYDAKGKHAEGSVGESPRYTVDCSATSGSVHVGWDG